MLNEPMETKFSIENRIVELEKASAMLEESIHNFGLPPNLIPSMNLALEEALTNIISYAYNDKLSHTIEIELALRDGVFHMVIRDDGKAYDPTKNPEPDITGSVTERPVGGLGIFLIRQLMDEVHYERCNSKNVLSMMKSV